MSKPPIYSVAYVGVFDWIELHPREYSLYKHGKQISQIPGQDATFPGTCQLVLHRRPPSH